MVHSSNRPQSQFERKLNKTLYLVVVVAICGLIYHVATKPDGPPPQVTPTLTAPPTETQPSPEQQVYEEQVTKYAFLVNNGGRTIEGCVQAGIAKAAAENLNNSVLFQRWQFVEQTVCGMDGSNPTIRSIADTVTADKGGGNPNLPYHGERAYRSWVEGDWLDIDALKN